MSTFWMAWAYKQQIGSVAAKAVLVKIADSANGDGIARPSIKTIAKYVELSRRAVQTNIRKLEEAGFLRGEEQHIGDVQLPNIYHLMDGTQQPTEGGRDR